MKPFKVFGLQRSGTNLAHLLVIRNFDAISVEGIEEWKHGFCTSQTRTFNNLPYAYIVCVKNPYAWMDSIYRYFLRSHGSDTSNDPGFSPDMTLSQFIRQPHYQFESPADRWTRMHRHWLAEIPADRRFVIQHERMLGDESNQLRVLEELGQTLGLHRRGRALVAAQEHIDVDGRSRRVPMDHAYYQSAKFLERFSREDLELIRNAMDPSLLEQLGYVDELPGPDWNPLRQAVVETPLRGPLSMPEGTTKPMDPPKADLAVTNTALTIGPNDAPLESSITFTASVTSSDGTPEGSVAFANRNFVLGVAPLISGLALFSTRTLGLGQYSVFASFAGNARYSGSSSEHLSLLVGTPNQRFLGQLYSDLLGRQYEAPSLALWTRQMDQGRTFAQVAADFTSSREYHELVIRGFCLSYFRRDATAPELKEWADQVDVDPDVRTVQARMLASPEFFNRFAGEFPQFLSALHLAALNGSAETSYFNSARHVNFEDPAARHQFVRDLLFSVEYSNSLIKCMYLTFLGREPEPHGLDAWRAMLASGTTPFRMVSVLVSSDEYLDRHQIRHRGL